MAIPATMRAINLYKPESPEYNTTVKVTDLTLNTSQPSPIPSPSEVLIQVHAVGITPYELTWPAFHLTDPRIPCNDVSGTIISAPATSAFKPGDKVFGLKGFAGQGVLAEYAIADPAHLAFIPEGLDFVQAASIPRATLTSWQALRVQKGGVLKEGMSVVVTGASGAVGRMGVQIAKLTVGEKGRVIAVGGVGSEKLRGVGADVVVNYRETPEWEREVGEKVDVLFDCLGGKVLERALPLVKDGGAVVSIGSPPPTFAKVKGWNELKDRGIEGIFFIQSESGEQLEKIGELVKNGSIQTSISFVVDGLSAEGVQDGWSNALKGGIGGSVIVKVL